MFINRFLLLTVFASCAATFCMDSQESADGIHVVVAKPSRGVKSDRDGMYDLYKRCDVEDQNIRDFYEDGLDSLLALIPKKISLEWLSENAQKFGFTLEDLMQSELNRPKTQDISYTQPREQQVAEDRMQSELNRPKTQDSIRSSERYWVTLEAHENNQDNLTLFLKYVGAKNIRKMPTFKSGWNSMSASIENMDQLGGEELLKGQLTQKGAHFLSMNKCKQIDN